jgi:hypothetical protein
MKHCYHVTKTIQLTLFREIAVIPSLPAVGAVQSFQIEAGCTAVRLSDYSYKLRDRLHPAVAYFETLLQHLSEYIYNNNGNLASEQPVGVPVEIRTGHVSNIKL